METTDQSRLDFIQRDLAEGVARARVVAFRKIDGAFALLCCGQWMREIGRGVNPALGHVSMLLHCELCGRDVQAWPALEGIPI